MINLSLIDIAQQVNGTLQGNDLIITNVSTDTREIGADSLFIALVGPNFNGHVFANEARQNGAVAMIASEPVEAHMPVIMVEDTKAALGALGAYVKQKVAPKTVGIIGSSVKTTVKEMATAILKECGSVDFLRLTVRGIACCIQPATHQQGHKFLGPNHCFAFGG